MFFLFNLLSLPFFITGIIFFNPLGFLLLLIFLPILSAEKIKKDLKKINLKPHSSFLYSQSYQKNGLILIIAYVAGFLISQAFIQSVCNGDCPELGNLSYYLLIGGLSILISLAYISLKTCENIKELILEKSAFDTNI